MTDLTPALRAADEGRIDEGQLGRLVRAAGRPGAAPVADLLRDLFGVDPASLDSWDTRPSGVDPAAGTGTLTEDRGSSVAAAGWPNQGPATSRYRPVRFVAEGGLGRVFAAIDGELGREVALKEIKEAAAGHGDGAARFVREAEITGNLEHPGIVPVYGLGAYADGRPYYAMRFVRGREMREAIRDLFSPPPAAGAAAAPTVVVGDPLRADAAASRTAPHAGPVFRDLLRRFIAVCQAVRFAHDRGVIHRDLKPANIMLGDYGETLVVDWGLAKRIGRPDAPRPDHDPGDDPTATRTGAVMGTPAYMSPEQADGRIDDLGPATDVYALGAMLAHLLTGRPPVSGPSVAAILTAVKAGRLIDPAATPGVPRPLAAISVKAMAKAPADRYPSAVAIAAEIERWLADEPTTAYADPPSVRARRWVRKHPATSAGSAAVALTALVGLALGLSAVGAKNAQLSSLNGALDERNGQLSANVVALDAANRRADGQRRTAEAERDAAVAIRTFLTDDLLLRASSRRWRPGDAGKPGASLRDPRIGELLDVAAARLDDRALGGRFADKPTVLADLLATIAESYQGIGRYEDAVRHCRRVRDLRLKALGEFHRDTLTAGFRHVLALIFAADFPTAISTGADLALSIRRQVQAIDDGDRADASPEQAALKAAAEEGLIALADFFEEFLGSTMPEIAAWQPPTGAAMAGPMLNMVRGATAFAGATARVEARYGPKDRRTLAMVQLIAFVHEGQGTKVRAMQEFRRVATAIGERFGSDSPRTLRLRSNVNRIAWDIEPTPAVAEEMRDTAARMRKALGPDDPDCWMVARQLAGAYCLSGLHDKALPLLVEVLDRTKARFGPDHPEAIRSANDLAFVHVSRGRPDLAVPMYETTVAAARAAWGPDNPTTLAAMSNLAGAYADNGRMDKAIPLFGEVASRCRAKFGPDHQETLGVLADLAAVHRKGGRTDLAIPLLTQVHEARRFRLGVEHRDTLLARNKLADALHAVGRAEEELQVLVDAAERTRSRFGDDHRATLAAKEATAGAYFAIGKPDKALPIFQDILARRRSISGSDHRDALKSMNDVANTLRDVGRPAEGLAMHLEALARRTRVLGPDHEDTLQSVNNVAYGHLSAGDVDKALPLLEEAWRRTSSLPPARRRQWPTIDEYPTLLAQRGRSDDAESLLAANAAAARAAYPAGDPRLSHELCRWASALARRRKFAEAEPLAREAAAGRGPSDDDWNCFAARSVLGECLAGLNRASEAEPLLSSAYEGLDKGRAGMPFRLRTTVVSAAAERLVGFYESTGRADMAARWRGRVFVGVNRFMPADVAQIVSVERRGAGRAVRAIERAADGWHPALPTMTAVVGRNGVAAPDAKKEGDGRTPVGTFRLGAAFGSEATADTKLAYRRAGPDDKWIDDPASPDYNRWIAGSTKAKSFEPLLRKDRLYRLAVVVEYNAKPVAPGKGSAIFLHAWEAPGKPTAGCVAVSEADLAALVRWLDKSRNPVLVVAP